jgi:uncharacterized protein YutE (UPF0331/DUF86 family)
VTPTKIRARVALERAAWIRDMLDRLRRLPTEDLAAFQADERTPAAAESCLRRALEGLFDLGRHVLSKGFGEGVVEYKQIAGALVGRGIVPTARGPSLTAMAGYRNRLTHFYEEVGVEELYEIVTTRLDDIEKVVSEIVAWLRAHPELVDRSL